MKIKVVSCQVDHVLTFVHYPPIQRETKCSRRNAHCFINLEKVYASVPRVKLWQALNNVSVESAHKHNKRDLQ